MTTPLSSASSVFRRSLLGASWAVFSLAGCALGPDYQRPDVTVPTHFQEAETMPGWKVAQPQDTMPKGAWWVVYGDAQLNQLLEQMESANQTVQAAEARYRQARALTQSARAALFPSLGASSSYSRSGRGSNTASAGSTVGRSGINESYNLGLDAGWEVDLWGKLRRSAESSRENAQASAADLGAARLSAQAELVQAYFQLRVVDAQQQLFDATVAAYQRSLQLTRNRHAAGVAARAEVVQAEAQLTTMQAQAIDNGEQRAQLVHAVALLLGRAPAELALPPMPLTSDAGQAVARLPQIPAALPSSLLERRPDVAAAEHRVAAANASIGVAKAAWFPSLNLSAAGGFQSSSVVNWLTVPSRVWSLGPSLALSLFDGGARQAQSDAAIAAYDAAVADYRQTVLTSFREVEDNLASLRILSQEAAIQREAVRLARESVTLTTNQYRAGTTDYLSVVTVQASALSSERTALSLLGRQLVASVGLIKALGGGWQAGDAESRAEAKAGHQVESAAESTEQAKTTSTAEPAAVTATVP